MKKCVAVFIMILAFSTAQADENVRLGNSAWPPFIIEGEEQGTAERIVCQALERTGRTCSVQVMAWQIALNEVRAGSLDGIAAAWRTPEREAYLLFSKPYITNRVVALVNSENPATVKSAADLADLRVALIKEFAYGAEIENMSSRFTVVRVDQPLDAITAVRDGKADVAAVDELVARNILNEASIEGVEITDSVIAMRDLHLAISRQNPLAKQIIDDFHRAYETMLADGTVNEILNIDWLASDFRKTGRLDLVMRSGVNFDELDNPSEEGSVYALGRAEHQMINESNLEPSRVNYQVEGTSYSSLQSALTEVFGKDVVCTHKEYSSEFDCSKLLKKLQSNP